jgi:hypothetical protein
MLINLVTSIDLRQIQKEKTISLLNSINIGI